MPDSGKPPFVEHAQRILAVLAERGDAHISMALIQGDGIGLTNARLKARNDDSVRDQVRFERIQQRAAYAAASNFGTDVDPLDLTVSWGSVARGHALDRTATNRLPGNKNSEECCVIVHQRLDGIEMVALGRVKGELKAVEHANEPTRPRIRRR